MILVMVLGFFLLLSGIVVDEFWSVRQAELMIHKIYLKEQAYYRAISAFESAIPYLQRDNTNYDSLNDIWATPVEFPLPEGKIKIQVEDEERYINLNLVQKKGGFEIVKRLFDILKINSLSAETLRTWVTGVGFWDREYPPKKAPLESLEELRFLGISNKDFYGKAIGFEFYPGLSQVATVWGSGRVNLNTAPVEVIMALSPQIDRTLAENLIEYRKTHPLKKVEDLLLVDGFTFEILHEVKPWATVKSEYFRITVEVKIGGVEGELQTIVKRVHNGFEVMYWRFS